MAEAVDVVEEFNIDATIHRCFTSDCRCIKWILNEFYSFPKRCLKSVQ